MKTNTTVIKQVIRLLKKHKTLSLKDIYNCLQGYSKSGIRGVINRYLIQTNGNGLIIRTEKGIYSSVEKIEITKNSSTDYTVKSIKEFKIIDFIQKKIERELLIKLKDEQLDFFQNLEQIAVGETVSTTIETSYNSSSHYNNDLECDKLEFEEGTDYLSLVDILKKIQKDQFDKNSEEFFKQAREYDFKEDENSSTSIYGRKQLDEFDVYETPSEVTETLMKHIKFNGYIYEPCCSSGKISDVLKDHNYNVVASDYRTDKSVVGFKGVDLLNLEGVSVDNIVTNTPYKDAIKFAKKCIELTKEGGLISLFYNLTFLESQERYNFFKEYPPKKVLIFGNRPTLVPYGYTGDKVAGCKQYAWFVWEKGYDGETEIEFVSYGDSKSSDKERPGKEGLFDIPDRVNSLLYTDKEDLDDLVFPKSTPEALNFYLKNQDKDKLGVIGKLDFLTGVKRQEILKKSTLEKVVVFSKRLNKSPIAYALYVFNKNKVKNTITIDWTLA